MRPLQAKKKEKRNCTLPVRALEMAENEFVATSGMTAYDSTSAKTARKSKHFKINNGPALKTIDRVLKKTGRCGKPLLPDYSKSK
jgi:hypothetical protein